MLALYEIEKIIWRIIKVKPRLSISNLIYVTELEENWCLLTKITGKLGSQTNTMLTFEILDAVEKRKTKQKGGFYAWEVKAKNGRFDLIDPDSFSGQKVREILDWALLYSDEYNKASVIVLAVIIAILDKKIIESRRISEFVGSHNRASAFLVARILNRLAELGLIQMIRVGVYHMIFRVE